MTTLRDLFLWLQAYTVTAVAALVMYPFYVLRNLRFHLTAPSVMLYAVLVFFLDRLTKVVIVGVTHHLPVPVIHGFFTLTFVKNPGVAFGWFPDWKLPPIIMAVVMVIIIAYYSFQLPPQERLTRWSLALLVGGAIGNLYDRVTYGFVIDFFLFHLGSFDFPVFNIADIAIDVGVFLLFVDIFLLSPDETGAPGDTPPQPQAA
jgi:signal peptidase II